ncbi:hypothetical protein O3G_MSEX012426 [Manduca sexta]|uniref:Alpha-1,6-mannosyl-glycoprotein 2-beta-N-acetylglucosaminyltransferase n=1 Tax=Manduca sexta TaxID=7130 RepID=A0A921ZN80_MANSE|nr:hypothetical protein O3G_MSEX012426 [Manduca sexta]
MPRLKYASVVRGVVILALFCLWLQIILSAGSGNGGTGYRDGGFKFTHDPIELKGLLIKKHTTVYKDTNSIKEQLVTFPPFTPVTEELMNANDTSEHVLALNFGFAIFLLASNKSFPDNPVMSIFFGINLVSFGTQSFFSFFGFAFFVVSGQKLINRPDLVFLFRGKQLHFETDMTWTSDLVIQIFYPYSIQTHPNEFPGMDPNDCPRDAKFEQAMKLKCINALHPDLHGHYREAKYAQTKHHWWWKANRIFNQLQCTANHTGLVLFLEEDHYVAEDFLHILSLLKSTADKSCPQCEIISLGTYLKTYQYHANSDKLEITPWHSSMHNMGFGFNRTVWRNIMELQDQFCAYDDYNWDYSLLHLSQNRPGREKFKVILCKGPRVFHIGECGFHHKKANCNASSVISRVQKLLQNAKPYLYPTRVTATFTTGGAKHNKKLTKGNGGWGDIRDQELCANMTRIGRQQRKYMYNT